LSIALSTVRVATDTRTGITKGRIIVWAHLAHFSYGVTEDKLAGSLQCQGFTGLQIQLLKPCVIF